MIKTFISFNRLASRTKVFFISIILMLNSSVHYAAFQVSQIITSNPYNRSQVRMFSTRKVKSTYGNPSNYALLAKILQHPEILKSFLSSFVPELPEVQENSIKQLSAFPQEMTTILPRTPYIVFRNASIVARALSTGDPSSKAFLSDKMRFEMHIPEKILVEVSTLPENINEHMISAFKVDFIKSQIGLPEKYYQASYGISIIGGSCVGDSMPLQDLKELNLPVNSTVKGTHIKEFFLPNTHMYSLKGSVHNDWIRLFKNAPYSDEAQMKQKISTPEVGFALSECLISTWDSSFLNTYRLVENYYQSLYRISDPGARAIKLTNEKKTLKKIAKKMFSQGFSKKSIRKLIGLELDDMEDL